MNRDCLLALAGMNVKQFAAAAPTLTYPVFAAACRLRLAIGQGSVTPHYERSSGAYETMIAAAFRIHCKRAAKGENVR